jgi:hypothetical protein
MKAPGWRTIGPVGDQGAGISALASVGLGWSALPIGAGGFLDGFTQANDGTRIVRADTYGAYKWNPNATSPIGNNGATGAWQQVVTGTSMPPILLNQENLGFGGGPVEICFAPSNSQIIYMIFGAGQGYPPTMGMYASANGGQTWQITNGFQSIGTSTTSNTIPSSTGGSFTWTLATGNFSQLAGGTLLTAIDSANSANYIVGTITSTSASSVTITCTAFGGSGTGISTWEFNYNNSSIYSGGIIPIVDPTGNNGNTWRNWAQKMAVHPTNPNIVYVGTYLGLAGATDGSTFEPVSGVPSGNFPAVTSIRFNPGNGDVAYCSSYENGIYQSTNAQLGGAATWSLLSGSPTTTWQAACSSYGTNGTYFSINNDADSGTLGQNGNLSVYNSTTASWSTAISDGTVCGVAVDPFNSQHIVAAQAVGFLQESFDCGVTWSGWSSSNNISSGTYNNSTGVVTLTLAGGQSIPNGSAIRIPTLSNGQLAGNYDTSSSSGSTVTYQAQAGLGSITITSGSIIAIASLDVPWLTIFGSPAVNNLNFDAVTQGKLYTNGDRQFCTTTLSGTPTTTNLTASTVISWVDQSVGVEQLTTNNVVCPNAGQPICTVWDSGVFVVPVPNPEYATVAQVSSVVGSGVVAGWSLDYASSNTDFLVMLGDGAYAGNWVGSSYATDGGTSGNWTLFVPPPTGYQFQVITGGTYVSGTGVITLTLNGDLDVLTGQDVALSGLQGSGSGSLNNNAYPVITGTVSTSITLQGPTGLGSITITYGGANTGNAQGNIAASTPQNVIFLPAFGIQPYYTTNFGTTPTWNAITLPNMLNLAITSGTYNSSTGVVTLTMTNAAMFDNYQNGNLTSLTGSGALSSIENGGPYQLTASYGSATISFTAASGLGSTSITGGYLSLTWEGFQFGNEFDGGTNTRIIAADRVTANTFYLFYPHFGIFSTSNGGATWTQVNNSHLNEPFDGIFQPQGQIKAVPNNAGHFFISCGGGPTAFVNSALALLYSENGGSTLNTVTSLVNPASVGFGAPALGQTYPSIYCPGWAYLTSTDTKTVSSGAIGTQISFNIGYSGSTNYIAGSLVNVMDSPLAFYGEVVSYVGGVLTLSVGAISGSGSGSNWSIYIFGVFKSIAGPATNMAWKQIGDTAFPHNSVDSIKDVSGDLGDGGLGRCFVTLGGSGYCWLASS